LYFVKVNGEVDLSIAYSAISIDRSHGHAEEMSYHEYIAAAMCKRVEIDETRVQAVFDMLDGDRTGSITASSIRGAIGNDIPEHVLAAMIGCASAVHAQAVASGENYAFHFFRENAVDDICSRRWWRFE
jgi:vacuolar-type H+-ATPase catalytic subunit A/Vma1